MSLNIVTITLNMETASFLGISIVGQSTRGGDGGIYVGSIMKGGAVAQDGRIEPGDMILEVNGISFENMSNDDAVRTLREAVQRPGPITLVVAKCWDPSPRGYFTIPRQEPIRPIDPSAWIMHSEACMGSMWDPRPAVGEPSLGPSGAAMGPVMLGRDNMTSATSSVVSSVPPNDFVIRAAHSSATSSSSHSSKSYADLNLTKNADMSLVVRAMAQPDSGLDVRDRMWLKIPIPHSFIGSELVDWLYSHVEGFVDRRDARRYACNLLKYGFIQHTVNKISFSEQCYYVFGSNVIQGWLCFWFVQTDINIHTYKHTCIHAYICTYAHRLGLNVSSRRYRLGIIGRHPTTATSTTQGHNRPPSTAPLLVHSPVLPSKTDLPPNAKHLSNATEQHSEF
ncbi:hypothetical protein HELRODRAFT_112621 [Helobdella robusta]|uniref:Uncharacterized protein n=1 Tax=Helobdella robusta TaxID=6412 RepID=T1EFK9_HELRO|nr:hypothetical protein HELRODRAFT_112621 [Helobdella robusta]ESO01627.1 hypothetical protein HELRODRAFT_112621 [Helobdella robusta]